MKTNYYSMALIMVMIAIAAGMIAGCMQNGQPVAVDSKAKDTSFDVQLLFETDNVKMYRFLDSGIPHYFAVQTKKVLEKEDQVSVDNTVPSGKSHKSDIIVTIHQ